MPPKTFLNQKTFKLQPENKPRVFANTIKIKQIEKNLEKFEIFIKKSGE